MRSLMRWIVRLLIRPVLSAAVPVTWQRRWGAIIGATLLGPKGARYKEQRRAGVPLLDITPLHQTAGRGVLLLHGGAYVMGGFASHRKLGAAVGDAASARVWLPDYRLAPEHPHPAALTDALAVYTDLLKAGQDPKQLSLVGDSAGGGLCLALALAIREAGLPAPAALVLMSPWVDLGLTGESVKTHARRDPMLKASWLRAGSAAYRAGTSTQDSACSPLHADLRGLPPTLIQVGSEEILLSDAQRLYDKASADGVDCQLQSFDGLWHVFQLQYRLLADANIAIRQVGDFIDEKTSQLAAA